MIQSNFNVWWIKAKKLFCKKAESCEYKIKIFKCYFRNDLSKTNVLMFILVSLSVFEYVFICLQPLSEWCLLNSKVTKHFEIQYIICSAYRELTFKYIKYDSGSILHLMFSVYYLLWFDYKRRYRFRRRRACSLLQGADFKKNLVC